MNITILAPDGSLLPFDGSNGISILGPDGAYMPNNGFNKVSIKDENGALRANDGTVPAYSILDADGSLRAYAPDISRSILDADGSHADADALEAQIVALFTNGEQGAWYDPSDLSTLYQNSAGTIPVTTVEQPVGMIQDKSGNGNHAFQATAASRPVLSARINVFPESEFRNGLADAPVRGGLITAESFSGLEGSRGLGVGWDGATLTYAYKSISLVVSTPYILSVFVRMDDGGAPVFLSSDTTNTLNDFALNIGGSTRPPLDYVVEDFGDGLYKVSAFYTTPNPIVNNHAGILKYTTNSSRTFKTSGYQLSIGTEIPNYQRTGPVNNLLTETEFIDGLADSSPDGGAVSATTFEGLTDGTGIEVARDTVTSYVYKTYTLAASTVYTFSTFIRMEDGSEPNSSTLEDFRMNVGGTVSPLPTITHIVGDLYRASLTVTTSGAPSAWCGVIKNTTGSTTKFKVSGFQLELGSEMTDYERVETAATTYDTEGFPHYLKYDGVDDSLATSAIDFSMTDKMTVWVGVREFPTSARATLLELSSTYANPGTFGFDLPNAALNQFTVAMTGSTLASRSGPTVLRPQVFTVNMNIGATVGAELEVRRDGVSLGFNTADAGSGNFTNNVLYIGRRSGIANPFNGRIYGLILRGAASTFFEIEAIEQYMAQKSGVTL
jgi:hypothetical protein